MHHYQIGAAMPGLDSISIPDINRLPPREAMAPGARKLRGTYAMKPDAPLYQREFGYYSIERWKEQGLPETPFEELFGFDPPGGSSLWGLGWCEAAFLPAFEEKVLEDRGDYELVQDTAGRSVLYFKGRRNGFMPEYTDHPVKDRASWERLCKWRLNPGTPRRYEEAAEQILQAAAAAKEGLMISQRLIGGYMYLRSLFGPEQTLYAFYDQPDLVRECMRTWLTLADSVIAFHQQYLTLDELFLAEDICYNHGPLISPEMIRTFLFPYYRELIEGVRQRQIDKSRHLFIQIDTDGDARPVIPVYREIGMDAMSPFEVASGCDVVEIGRQYPELRIFGGIDKRVLAAGKEAIDRHIDYILPAMKKRGGYIPTCDHGVPEEVRLEDYMHYRRRCREFS